MTTVPPEQPQTARAGRGSKPGRAWLMLALLLGALLLSAILAAGLGAVHYSPAQVLAALRHGPPNLDAADIDPVQITLWSLRLPRILMAMVVGGSLAASGVALQSLLRNDLADPYVVGVSSGASVGAEIAYLRHAENVLGGAAVPVAAFAGGVAAMTLVYGMARRGGQVLVTSLLLGGVVVSAFLGAVSTLILQISSPDDAFRTLNRLMGSLQDSTLPQCAIAGGFLVFGALILFTQSRAMNVFALGEESAKQLGVDTERFKSTLIVTASLLTASTVAFAGMIGFVGLIVPHAARRLAGTPDHVRVLPLATVAGALLMVWADTLARSIMPDSRELPVGVITAFLGAPFFIYLLRRHGR
ncbi:MAG: iron ABC transporter permease [Capsulimonas sp.]|uniref:FecCD family ABC transporter permease n=1 Tax=Capsulimonas sp. TaxID=2494211 RepID=UPI0032643CD4